MFQEQLFQESTEDRQGQGALALDDGAGLRVVRATFIDEHKFDWDLFQGYDCLRVLTYSASVKQHYARVRAVQRRLTDEAGTCV